MHRSSAHPPRLPRVPFDRHIRVKVGEHEARMRATNLSLGGMFIEAERPPTVGARVSVALETGRSALKLGEAEVVWRRSGSNPGERSPLPQYGFGLRFVVLAPTAQSLVEAVVRHGGTSSVFTGSSLGSHEAPTKPDLVPLPPEPKTDPQA